MCLAKERWGEERRKLTERQEGKEGKREKVEEK